MKKIIKQNFIKIGIVLVFVFVFLIEVCLPLDFILATADPSFNNHYQDSKTLRFKNRTRGDTVWQSSLSASPGDRIAFDVYYHNTVDDSVANNTKIRLDFEDNQNSRFSFKAYLWADNADYVSDIGTVNIDCSEGLNIVFDSTALWYPNQATNSQQLNVSFVQSNSALVNIGDISGGWPSQGHVVFEGVISDSQAKFNFQTNDKKTIRLKNRTRGDSYWQNSVSADAGDLIAFDVYYNNGAECSTAKNTKVKIVFSTFKQSNIIPTAYISADNAATINDTATIYVSTPEKLNFENTALWYPRQSTVGTSKTVYKTSNSVEVNIGDIGGSCEDQGHVVFEALLSETSEPSPNFDFSIQKWVKNLSKNHKYWHSSVSADPSHKVAFRIKLTSTGNTTLNNVFVKDTLPSKMKYLGNLEIDGSSSSGNITSGFNIGNLSPGASKIITFEAQIYSENSFIYGQTTLINTVLARDSNISKTDTVEITVNKKAVAGEATEVDTGFQDTILHSILPPFLAASTLIFIFKEQLFKFDEWMEVRKKERREYWAKKTLSKKIAQIREKENIS